MSSILRWSGSKAKLVPRLVDLIPPRMVTYIEPFAGSASLFFSLRPVRAILGDKNAAVIDIYRAVKRNPTLLNALLESIPKTSDGYYLLRSLDERQLTVEQRAARLIFLMKACFNGVFRTNMAGKFNVPMGSRIYALPTYVELTMASSALRGARLISGDFEKTLSLATRGDLVYLDPPYKEHGRYRGEYGYSAHFSESDLSRLIGRAKELAQDGILVILSYADDERILDLLPTWNVMRYELVRTVAGAKPYRRKVREIILTSYQA